MARLALLGLAMALVIVGSASSHGADSVPIQPRTEAWEWEETLLGVQEGGTLSPPEYSSKVRRVPISFNAVGILWQELEAGSEPPLWSIRVSADGRNWSPWRIVPSDDDGPDETGPWSHSQLLVVPPSRYAQYRIVSVGGGGPLPPKVRLAFIDSRSGPSVPASGLLSVASLAPPSVISRAQWGADETYRTVSPRYRAVRRVVVHHSASSDGGANPAATVRAIYYYHAVTLEWGDVGYNYLVDSSGNIYEGRHGGPDAVGTHTEGYNTGVLGIAAIGTYDAVEPSQKLLEALVRVLGWISEARGIDPMGKDMTDKGEVPYIMGHREVNATDCPGDRLYARLPDLRSRVLQVLGRTPKISARIVGVKFLPSGVHVGDLVQVDIAVQNTGTVALPSQGPPPGFVYGEEEDYLSRGLGEVAGSFRVAVSEGNKSGPDHPYRWGLGQDLPPGAVATITGYIRVASPGPKSLAVGLVQEYGDWLEDSVGLARVSAFYAAADASMAPGRLSPRLYLPLVLQGGSVWQTEVQLQNPSEAPAEGRLSLRDQEGREASSYRVAVPAFGSQRVELTASEDSSPAAQSLSAVVEASRPLAGFVRLVGLKGDSASYSAAPGGSVRVPLPLLFKAYNGWNSGIQVQNVGTAPTTVLVTFRQTGGAGIWQERVMVPSGGFATLYLPASPLLPASFVGSALLESVESQPIVAVANNVGADGAAMSYLSYTEGSPVLAAPLLFRGYQGWRSGLQVMNSGTEATNVSVVITATGASSVERRLYLEPGASDSLYLPAVEGLAEGTFGFANIVSGEGRPVAAAVSSQQSGRGVATAYMAGDFNSVLYIPKLSSDTEGWRTGIQVVASGTTAQGRFLNLRTYDSQGRPSPSLRTVLAANSSATYYAPAIPLQPGFTGSAILSSDGASGIAAATNDVR